jgi:predicted N-formylglutamate amidohydrolase
MSHLILTCEHGGCRVPAEYRKLFAGASETLRSHRGWDPGSLDLARTFEKRFAAPLFFNTVTRLLVELNRSPEHPRLFSEFTRGLDPPTRQSLLERYYHPYRQRVEAAISEEISRGKRVVHLSLHTFVPTLNGVTRTADVGLLYDPARPLEVATCRQWQADLKRRRPDLRVRRNYPYLGKSDGFTTHLRRQFSPERYAGIELEVNQRWPDDPLAWSELRRELADSLAVVLAVECL